MNKNIKPPRDLASLSFLLIHIQTKIQGRLPVVHLAGHFDTAGNEGQAFFFLFFYFPLPSAKKDEFILESPLQADWGGKAVAFVRLSFPLWKHARKESRRMRQV